MVEVFKTDVEDSLQAQHILDRLQEKYPGYEINFDLEDCDHILRVSGTSISVPCIISLLKNLGFLCEVLGD